MSEIDDEHRISITVCGDGGCGSSTLLIRDHGMVRSIVPQWHGADMKDSARQENRQSRYGWFGVVFRTSESTALLFHAR